LSSSNDPIQPGPREPDPLYRQFLAKYTQHEQARLDAAKATLKSTVIPRLRNWGVAKVHAEYSGYGDSGAINFIAYLDAHGQPMNLDMVRAASDPEIERVLYEFLPSGFEINDGGQGDVYIDVQAGTVKLEHEENYTDSRASSREWEV
jgi:hypothetical protein